MGASSHELIGPHFDLVLLCETCESPIDLLDDVSDRGVCRHCGLAFDLGPPAVRSTAV